MRFKAGRYYIGDPCYVIKAWDDFINLKYPNDSVEPLEEVKFQGHDVWVGNTKFGDGEYQSDCGSVVCGVDSGTIGVVPLELIDEETQRKEAANIISFEEDFNASVDDNGTFEIGHLDIATNWSDEDLDDEDDEDDDFYDDDVDEAQEWADFDPDC